jgi:hypothetical protein
MRVDHELLIVDPKQFPVPSRPAANRVELGELTDDPLDLPRVTFLLRRAMSAILSLISSGLAIA